MTPIVAAAWVAFALAGLVSSAVRSRRPMRLPTPAAVVSSRPSARRGPLRIPVLAERRAAKAAAEAVAAAVPDLVDLVAVAVAAGCNVRLATFAVATRAPPGPVRQALATAQTEVEAGARLADALERVPTRLRSDAVRPLIAALVDAERYGTALGPTLERLAADARRTRQRRAEEIARRLPVKLLFPLVTCILPAFGLLTVAPLIAGGLRALRP
jgi:tight adherence protein C